MGKGVSVARTMTYRTASSSTFRILSRSGLRRTSRGFGWCMTGRGFHAARQTRKPGRRGTLSSSPHQESKSRRGCCRRFQRFVPPSNARLSSGRRQILTLAWLTSPAPSAGCWAAEWLVTLAQLRSRIRGPPFQQVAIRIVAVIRSRFHPVEPGRTEHRHPGSPRPSSSSF